MNFLEYYRNNLALIRTLASEFAAEFPKIASRLELSGMECQAPYVERLLEGSAFLAARVEEKLERGFPRLLESVLSAVAPLTLYPVASYTVLDLDVDFSDERLKSGVTIAPGDQFQCKLPSINTPCTFTSMGEKTLYPIDLAEAVYVTNELEEYDLARKDILSALVLKFDFHGTIDSDNAAADHRLSFFLNLPDNESASLQELLLAGLEGIYLRQGGKTFRASPRMQLSLPHFQESGIDSFKAVAGLRKLQHYMICPALFKFFELSNAQEFFDTQENSTAEIIFAFRRRENCFIKNLHKENFKLWALPAVNIFQKKSDRSDFHGQYEQQVIAERTAPQDYEVFKVLSATAYNARNQQVAFYRPCYEPNCSPEDNFFIQHRRARIVNTQRLMRTSYPGSELFISFAGKNHEEKWESIQQFQAETLCTNRDIPLLLRMSDVLTPVNLNCVKKAAFLTQPNAPGEALCARGTQEDWRRIGYIAMNFSSLLWQDGDTPLKMLKELIAAYSSRTPEENSQLLDGMLSLYSEPKEFRFVNKGSVYFESGWHCELTLREESFAGFGIFTFACILKELMFSYIPLNSCMELVLHTDKRREVAVWRA